MGSLALPHDITTMTKVHFPEVWDRIRFHSFSNPKKIASELASMKEMMAITVSACLDENEHGWAISRMLSFGLSFPRYFIFSKDCRLRSMNFYCKPSLDLAQQIWNLPENGMIKEVAKLGMKNISTNVKLYIPVDTSKTPEDITRNDGDSIQVRLLYDENIYFKKTGKQTKLLTCCGGQSDQDIETAILHIHGGGFLALSSRSMQVYTRRWAIELKVPVFSVDYRMPPDYPFPTAPQDCLTVYRFLVHHIHEHLNIRPQRIIVAGDSAGGNLAFSLTGMVMKEGLPHPYGIYAAYPACSLVKTFSPSKLHAFTDPLLNPPMLLLCEKEYLSGRKEVELDPMASPLLLTEDYVGGKEGDKRFPLKWPKTAIQVGAKDPLFDDSLKIMARMVESDVNCECQVYTDLSHGFLNLEFAVPDCKKTIDDSIVHLEGLLK
jgi:hormone-sensitive lipase